MFYIHEVDKNSCIKKCFSTTQQIMYTICRIILVTLQFSKPKNLLEGYFILN